jgi:hypothetical protein
MGVGVEASRCCWPAGEAGVDVDGKLFGPLLVVVD